MTSVAGMQKARTTRKEYRMEEEEEIIPRVIQVLDHVGA